MTSSPLSGICQSSGVSFYTISDLYDVLSEKQVCEKPESQGIGPPSRQLSVRRIERSRDPGLASGRYRDRRINASSQSLV
jgi:hypothetical protein